MPAKTIMVQGTASNAGKSILVAALCRIVRQAGYSVAPFKAQNMSLNSYVTPDGGEIGRAQAVQAEAAGCEMSVDMNPILLKPEADARSQVVVQGRPFKTLSASGYYDYKTTMWPIVMESLARLRTQYEVIVIEGAGSPAEVNLRERDIVNMAVAKAVQSPVVLVADIDRGGALAALVGTMVLLEPDERELVKALVLNKFRGDIDLLKPAIDIVEQRTGVPMAGVVPFMRDLGIAEEDSVVLDYEPWRKKPDALLEVAVIHLPHMSNFDDFDALEADPRVALRLVEPHHDLGEPDLIILPGTKTTIADLDVLRRSGLGDAICQKVAAGTPVIGICGGYQMLGRVLHDPEHVESSRDAAEGLGLLPLETSFVWDKTTHQVKGKILGGHGLLSYARDLEVRGYEIHSGDTSGGSAPAVALNERSSEPIERKDGAISDDGLVLGTYLHGFFDQPDLRYAIIRWLAERKGLSFERREDRFARQLAYDRLADNVRASLDMDLIWRLIGLGGA
jgi:adenosylcobyric acid synthase